MNFVDFFRTLLKLVMNFALAWVVIINFQNNIFIMVTAAFWLMFSFAELFEQYEQREKIKMLIEDS